MAQKMVSLGDYSFELEKNVYSAVVSNKAQYNAATPPQGYPLEHELQAFMFIASTEDYSQHPHTIRNSINRKKDKWTVVYSQGKILLMDLKNKIKRKHCC